ncbi:MAG: 16S rRNA (cytidine(1402)-2'-O)-methyltransferase [Bacteroidetes bacterium]|nr:16S rRNA (cytidine(1402)-2'-O)-methyltransferase [Bacteroidota bacterium]
MKPKANGKLTIVATPIGNLGDFTPRASETLSNVDIIACEDTRVTRKLLRLTGTNTSAKLVPYHDHNGAGMRPWLIEKMETGVNVALVSDAGTPLISDPGYKLVAACRDQNIGVFSTPGASAVITALAVSGLPTDRFLFAGFVPSGASARQDIFKEFAQISATTIWFDAPSRLAVTLGEMAEIMGPRIAVIARELTKLHEEIIRGDLADLATRIKTGPTLKGEIVLVVAGDDGTKSRLDDEALVAMISAELEGQSVRDAVASVVETTGIAKNRVYKLALSLVDKS